MKRGGGGGERSRRRFSAYFESAEFLELLITTVKKAGKRPSFTVDDPVRVHVAALSECLSTDVAGERAFSRVPSFVALISFVSDNKAVEGCPLNLL